MGGGGRAGGGGRGRRREGGGGVEQRVGLSKKTENLDQVMNPPKSSFCFFIVLWAEG